LFDPVQTDLALVEDAIRRVGNVEYPVLASLLEHVLASRGKRVRPALVLLAASFNEYQLEFLVPLAAAIELLHTATLVHDDLIDNSDVRRGRATLHNMTSKAAAVLVGDYLFANAASLCTQTESVRVMRVFGQALMTIVDGELKQLFTSGFWRQTREDYYQKIQGKTASLLRTATETGAILSLASEAEIAALGAYGYNLGMAFQIVDDVLDFVGTEADLGKPVGSDLRQGTITLPAIRLLETEPDHEAIRRVCEDGDFSDGAIERAVDAVRASDGIRFALEQARGFARHASTYLETLPDTSERRALENLTYFVIDRVS
ncbi:MAG TPA: polyprenyl synthetase family protein, partial [Chloroflexota bacterium]|nr:polyprenyl synthetase family protein [Chloroflexota bacterium]